MNGVTHLCAGLVIAAAFAQHDPRPPVLIAAVIGSIMPDIDHHRSMISSYAPGSGMIRRAVKIKHRGITHTLLFMVAAVGLFFMADKMAAAALGVSFISHLVLDMMTPAGVRLFHPFWHKRFGIIWVVFLGLILAAFIAIQMKTPL